MLWSPRTPWTRRGFLRSAVQASALLSAPVSFAAPSHVTKIAGTGHVEPGLAGFVGDYMVAMAAPGMTLALLRGDGSVSTAGFGFSNVYSRQLVTPEMLFQIGSISKSFCALALLQMHEEGKLDLHAPVLEYLPWLPLDMPFGAISAHHLLTHTAGIPDDQPLFTADPTLRLRQAYAPGKQFWYSNTGFEILGRLAATLDGTSYAACLRKRLLEPLGMMQTQAAITDATTPLEPQSYMLLRNLAGTRNARLTPAAPVVFTDASGCMAAPAGDMGLYLHMLARRGEGPRGRLVSEKSFGLFATPFVDASEDFGPGFSYGYGMAVSVANGRTVLRHTGGMASFASSLQVDLDAGVGAFASVNAMQGYRPNPVTTYALAVLRAQATHAAVPAPEPVDDPRHIPNAAEYSGSYSGAAGTVEVVAQGSSLHLKLPNATVALEHAGGDTFVAADEAYQAYPWRFAREASKDPGAKGAPTELFYGPDWYVSSAYTGPKEVAAPAALAGLPGLYAYDPGSSAAVVEVYLVKGMLYMDSTRLDEIGEGLFRPAHPGDSPERVQFLHAAGGKPQMLVASGQAFLRVEVR